MGKLKLMTIVGTRPEIIKMSAIIKKADKYFDQILVHTGQNYDYTLNEVFFKDLGLREPDFYLGVVGKNIPFESGLVAVVRTTDTRFRILKRESGDLITAMAHVEFKTAGGLVIAVATKGVRAELQLRHLEIDRDLRVWAGAVAEADEGVALRFNVSVFRRSGEAHSAYGNRRRADYQEFLHCLVPHGLVLHCLVPTTIPWRFRSQVP